MNASIFRCCGLAVLLAVACDGTTNAPTDLGDVVDTPPEPRLMGPVPDGEVRAGIISSPLEFIGGPKAEAKLGDLKIENAHVRFIVEGARQATGGYRYWGGHVVDADVARPADVPGHDLYGEQALTWNLDIFMPEEVEIISDGADGTAHLRLRGQTDDSMFADHVLRNFMDAEDANLTVVYDYTLGPDDHALRLKVTLTNEEGTSSLIDTHLVISCFGDGVMSFRKGLGFEGGVPSLLPWMGAVGRDVSYGLISADDDLQYVFSYAAVEIAMVDTFKLNPGASITLERWYMVTDQSSLGLDAIARAVTGDDTPLGAITGVLNHPATVAPDSAYLVVRSEGGEVYGLTPVGADGAFSFDVPTGSYTLKAWAPSHAPSVEVQVDVVAGEEAPILQVLDIPEAATFHVTLRDAQTDEPIAAKASFVRQGDTPSCWPPGDVAFTDSPSGELNGVALSNGTTETLVLPAGTYEVVGSRGFSHELDVQTVTVAPGEVIELDFSLWQVIDTSGWTSTDFHVHATWSPDSNAGYGLRARQAAADGLDLLMLTEHVYVGNAQPAIEAEGLADVLHGAPAQEITTFQFGHFNGFPFVEDHDAFNRGAVFPYEKTPQELFAAARAQNDGPVAIQINHPRGSAISSYFSRVGLDTTADTVLDPEMWSTNWDSIEAFNGGCGPGEAYADWVGLTNHGYGKTLSGGSDVHTAGQGPGVPRTWLQVPLDDVRSDQGVIATTIHGRRAFVSCGPFVTFETDEGVPMGGLATVDEEGRVRFNVVVQAPSWIQVDKVTLVENGAAIQVLDVATSEDTVRRLDTVLEVEPAADAWYALQVIGSGSMAPVSFRGPPNAFTNAIEVDADGDGAWTPPGAP